MIMPGNNVRNNSWLLFMQRLREEKEAAVVQLFRDHTLRQRQIRQKLEEEYQKEELLHQGKLAEGLQSIHRLFAERERQVELQLTKKCSLSPMQGSVLDLLHLITFLCNIHEPLSCIALTMASCFN